jgi:hypothetical protein
MEKITAETIKEFIEEGVIWYFRPSPMYFLFVLKDKRAYRKAKREWHRVHYDVISKMRREKRWPL